MYKKIVMGFFSLVLAISLAACGNNSSKSNNGMSMNSDSKKGMNMDHSKMEMGDSSGALKGMNSEKNPTYKVGSQVVIDADHMVGMKGAKGIVKGAYATTVYMVNYTPTTGGAEVKNHKWVVQEEIKGAGNKLLKPGTKVTLTADHMKGMKGASATIVSSQKTTVYMVDYKPTTGGAMVNNHKWVIEDELSAAK